ncbi:hypothetical protein BGW80DRAFT_1124780, partial [Lactifluus volemus]
LSKEARNTTNARRQELRTAYTNSVQALALEVKDKVSSIAVEHKKSCDAVQAALNVGSGAFNKGRHAKASPWHAFLWKKAQVERDEGSSFSRDELPNITPARSSEYQALSSEEKEQYVKEYQEWRETRQLGEWTTGRSKTNDVVTTGRNIEIEFERLASRTGAAALCFIVCGSPGHPMKPVMFATRGLLDFVQSGLGFDVGDFLAQLEGFTSWGIKGVAKNHTANVTRLRQAVTDMINRGLQEITGQKDLQMKWGTGYWTRIVCPHCVIIRSWPSQVKFECISKSCSSVCDLQLLLEAWTEATTHWVQLSDAEFAEEECKRADDIRARILPADKSRKTRSDKGRKRTRTE